METTSSNKYPEIMAALRRLSLVCDRANSLDGRGFNRYDTDFGKALAEQEYLTNRQAIAAHRMLRKYRTQLNKLGIDWESIPNPSLNTDAVGAGMGMPRAHPKRDSITMKATKSNNMIDLEFRFPMGDDRFGKILDRVRTMPGRSFNKETKVWSVPITEYVMNELVDMGFVLSDDLKQWIRSNNTLPKLNFPKGLHLYPFQEKGVQYVERQKGVALIADEMGLGKTIQAIGWLTLHPELRPAIVICPATIKTNWEREIKKWMPGERIRLVYGRGNGINLSSDQIIIINYDILSNHIENLEKIKPKVMIFDECHYIKNMKAMRTKAIRQLGKNIPHKIALSGTPITNRPGEFFSALNLLREDLFPSWYKYASRYCEPIYSPFGVDYKGAANTEELHKILTQSIMVRRTKAEVLPDLPSKIRSVLPLDLENRSEYDAAARDLLEWIEENEGVEAADRAGMAETLVKFEKLKQLAVRGKMKEALQWIHDFIESGEKLVVFATHHETIDMVMKEFGDIAVKLDGRDSQNKKQEAVDKFQTDDSIRIFVGNIKAAGVGITLTKSSNTCFLELGWTPGEHDQAEDRVHRIGQEADSVTAWYLLATNSIEEDIADLLDQKRKTLDAVLDGKVSADESLLTELLNKFKGGKK